MEVMPKILQARKIPLTIAMLLKVRNDLVPAGEGVQANWAVGEMHR